MPVRKSEAVWNGTLKEGKGTVKVGDGVYEGPYSFASRFEEGAGTNPEELIGAAHAGCFSQAFSLSLEQAGYKPSSIRTSASVHLDKAGEGFKISKIQLETAAEVGGIDEDTFQKIAEDSKTNCPVSKALAGAEITIQAKLLAPAG